MRLGNFAKFLCILGIYLYNKLPVLKCRSKWSQMGDSRKIHVFKTMVSYEALQALDFTYIKAMNDRMLNYFLENYNLWIKVLILSKNWSKDHVSAFVPNCVQNCECFFTLKASLYYMVQSPNLVGITNPNLAVAFFFLCPGIIFSALYLVKYKINLTTKSHTPCDSILACKIQLCL